MCSKGEDKKVDFKMKQREPTLLEIMVPKGFFLKGYPEAFAYEEPVFEETFHRWF